MSKIYPVSDYFTVRGDTIEDIQANLAKNSKDDLVGLVINNRLNEFVGHWADKGEGDSKFIPYVGWFWRSTDFVGRHIAIGDCGEFIGVMENNKWDYPERELTVTECDQVIAIILEAKRLSEEGGLATDISKKTRDKLAELWPLFQTFKIERRGES